MEGAGIVLKSYCEVAADLKANRLQIVLEDYPVDFRKEKLASDESVADLYIVYPSRQYLPKRLKEFTRRLQAHFNQ